jgi:hypothetical protein
VATQCSVPDPRSGFDYSAPLRGSSQDQPGGRQLCLCNLHHSSLITLLLPRGSLYCTCQPSQPSTRPRRIVIILHFPPPRCPSSSSHRRPHRTASPSTPTNSARRAALPVLLGAASNRCSILRAGPPPWPQLRLVSFFRFLATGDRADGISGMWFSPRLFDSRALSLSPATPTSQLASRWSLCLDRKPRNIFPGLDLFLSTGVLVLTPIFLTQVTTGRGRLLAVGLSPIRPLLSTPNVQFDRSRNVVSDPDCRPSKRAPSFILQHRIARAGLSSASHTARSRRAAAWRDQRGVITCIRVAVGRSMMTWKARNPMRLKGRVSSRRACCSIPEIC